MILNLCYELLEHPYKDAPSSIGEHWSKIKVEILDRERTVKTVFDIHWDIGEFLVWFTENEKALQYEEMPVNNKSTSIAKGIHDFYEVLNPDIVDDQIVDNVYDYRTRHEIWFAMRGIKNIDNIFIGPLNNKMTISFCDDNNEWNYEIEIKHFFEKVKYAYKEIFAL